jgi:hypothetical protein
MKHARSRRPLLLAGVLSAGVLFDVSAAQPEPPGGAAPSKTKAPDKKGTDLAVPPGTEPLSDAARALLHKKMGRHGLDARDLMYGVTLLRYDVARAAAQRIASEPRLVRPEPGSEDDQNNVLPERFYLLQGEVRMRAQAIVTAADQRNDKLLAENYGLLVQTCVACHSAYRKR